MVETVERRPPPARDGTQSSAAVQALLRIAEHWHLNDRDISTLMGGVSIPSVQRWRRQLREDGEVRTELNRDQLDRISYALGIYKALHILFPDNAQADRWIHRPVNMPGFDGRAAIDLIRNGGMVDLQYIRRFLDGWRG